MQEALLSLLLLQHLVVAKWRVLSHGLEREAVLALRSGWKKRGQSMGQLGPGGENRNSPGPCYRVPLGTESRAAHGRNASMLCSTQPSQDMKLPGRWGANAAKPKPLPIVPQPGFWGTAWEQGGLLHSPQHPGTLPAAAPLCRGMADAHSPSREAALPRWVSPPRAPGSARG